MKFTLVLLLFFLAQFSHANELGAGISLGNPTGLNVKRFLDKKSAIDGGLGMSVGKHKNLSLHGDYLLHSLGALYFNDIHPLDLYYGVGARMEFADDIELGLRLPIGVSYMMENQASDIFFELAPIWDFVSRNGLELHFLIGGRYYFK